LIAITRQYEIPTWSSDVLLLLSAQYLSISIISVKSEILSALAHFWWWPSSVIQTLSLKLFLSNKLTTVSRDSYIDSWVAFFVYSVFGCVACLFLCLRSRWLWEESVEGCDRDIFICAFSRARFLNLFHSLLFSLCAPSLVIINL
jgi:hypothetical protein